MIFWMPITFWLITFGMRHQFYMFRLGSILNLLMLKYQKCFVCNGREVRHMDRHLVQRTIRSFLDLYQDELTLHKLWHLSTRSFQCICDFHTSCTSRLSDNCLVDLFLQLHNLPMFFPWFQDFYLLIYLGMLMHLKALQ